eukprot:4509215-Prorocentrum_lima.AAC.1
MLKRVAVMCLGFQAMLLGTLPVMMNAQNPPSSCALPSWHRRCMAEEGGVKAPAQVVGHDHLEHQDELWS